MRVTSQNTDTKKNSSTFKSPIPSRDILPFFVLQEMHLDKLIGHEKIITGKLEESMVKLKTNPSQIYEYQAQWPKHNSNLPNGKNKPSSEVNLIGRENPKPIDSDACIDH